MPKFNLNKLRSAGLRYIVADADGQMWAFEKRPIRSMGHWKLANEHICPVKEYGAKYQKYWKMVMHWHWQGRSLCIPIYDVPITLTFDDEPYDIVENGLVAISNLKVWPNFGGID